MIQTHRWLTQFDHESPSAGLNAAAAPAPSVLKLPVTWFDTTNTTLYCALRMRMQFATWNIMRERRLASYAVIANIVRA